jgi:hypothetical protein
MLCTSYKERVIIFSIKQRVITAYIFNFVFKSNSEKRGKDSLSTNSLLSESLQVLKSSL